MAKQYDKQANGWIERIHAENNYGTEASWWAVILVNEHGNEIDRYARCYENGFSTRITARTKLSPKYHVKKLDVAGT